MVCGNFYWVWCVYVSGGFRVCVGVYEYGECDDVWFDYGDVGCYCRWSDDVDIWVLLLVFFGDGW